MTAMRLLGALDPSFAWDGDRLLDAADLGPGHPVPGTLRGAATVAAPGPSGAWRLLRDPLGIGKLFWAAGTGGGIDLAARPQRLVHAGHPFAAIRSLPRGRVLDLASGPARGRSLLPAAWQTPAPGDPDPARVARQVRDVLDRYLAALAARHAGRPWFVCLSGGLDSSGIAALARRHLPGLVAVSFDVDRPGGRASEDRAVARRLARDLGLPLLTVTVRAEQLLDHLDTVLVEGVDWRDFNVHAALVNAALAAGVAAAAPGTRPLVLTGDLANEFLVDYAPERVAGSTYYDLPRLAPEALRTSLVRGLDSSHREVGVFAAWGLDAVQPYAVAVDAYLRLPAAFLTREDRKQRLCRDVFGDLLPGYVYGRRKSRAQVGDPRGGGVLDVCLRHGIDAGWLRARFARLHGVDDHRTLDRFVRAGLYRAAPPATTEAA